MELEIDSELTPGTLIGEYRVESKLGQGGMASVYAGTQPVIGKKVAIKVMSRQLCVDPVQVERFVQEARAVNQIGHPNIVDVFAFGVLPDGRSYFVMEWLQGETLAARLRRGTMSFAEAVAVIFQICDGLAAAHDKSVVHRDLKPENIFLVPVRNRRLLVKLLDFGIAKLLGRRDARIDRTAQGASPGTPLYMSPEQARGKDIDHRTDIYSLGVTAFEMLCGRRPFESHEVLEILYKHAHEIPPAPSTLRPDVPLQLERLVLAMLDKKPDRRPTVPVIEETLADLRDDVLRPLGDSGPIPLRALEDSGRFRAPRLPQRALPAVERTDTVTVALPRTSRTMIVVAVALAVLAAIAVTWRLTRPSATTATGPVAPAAVEPPSQAAGRASPGAERASPGAERASPGTGPSSAGEPSLPSTRRMPAAVPPHRLAKHDAARPSPPPTATPAATTTPAAPAATTPAAPAPAKTSGNRDYMIDPFAAPKK